MLVNGAKDPRFGRVPEIESFAKYENGRSPHDVPDLEAVGVPDTLSPGTLTDRLMILQDAHPQAVNDAEFHREYKNLTDEDPDPLMPEEMEKAIVKCRATQRRSNCQKTFRRGPASRGITNYSKARPDNHLAGSSSRP